MSPASRCGSRSAIVWSTAAAGTISHSARGWASLATRSASEAAPVARSLTMSATACAERSKTTQSWPPLMSRRAMLAPMRPSPIIPSCMSVSLCGGSAMQWRPAHGRSLPRQGRRRRAWLALAGLIPEPQAAEEGVAVFGELPGVAAADQDVVGGERGGEARNDVGDLPAPFLLAQAFEAAQADVILVGRLLVRQVAQFHRLDDAFDDHRRTEAGTEADKKHLATLVAAQCLHRRIVDDLGRAAEGGLVVEPHPPRPEVVRLGDRAAAQDGTRITNCDRGVGPVAGELLHARDHLRGRQGRPQWKFAGLGLPAGQNLDVGTADIDHQYLHRDPANWPPAYAALARAALFDAITSMSSLQDLAKATPPSSCSLSARASTSTPALPNSANTASQSPPSAAIATSARP